MFHQSLQEENVQLLCCMSALQMPTSCTDGWHGKYFTARHFSVPSRGSTTYARSLKTIIDELQRVLNAATVSSVIRWSSKAVCRQYYADSGWTCQRGSPASRLSWCTATCMVRHLNTSPIISLQPLTSLPGFVSVLQTDNNNFSYVAVDSTRTAVGLSDELNPARVVQTVLKSS